jgi:hypothetical protein
MDGLIYWYQLKSVVTGEVIADFRPFEEFVGDIGEHIFINGAGPEDEYEIVDYAVEPVSL